MDEQLLQRFRDGDPGATVPLRNQLRTLAARVLAAPQWGIQDSGTRAGLEREAAQASLSSGANTAVALTEDVLAQAGAQGIELLRSREPGTPEEHPAALELARVGTQTASAVQMARVEAHTQACPKCSQHLDILKNALRVATTAQRAPAQPAPVRPRAKAPRPKSARRKDGPSKPVKPKQAAGSKSGGIPWLAVLAGVAVVAGIVWRLQPSDEQKVWARAELLPDELPPSARAALYSGPAKRAISQLADGNCRESATTLHLQAKGSGDPYLHWYEGVAWVCARDGSKALEALDQVTAAEEELPWGYDWWRAQALVLDGQSAQALVLLDDLAASKHARAGDASALASRLRAQ